MPPQESRIRRCVPLEQSPISDRVNHQPRASTLYAPGIRVAVADVMVELVRVCRRRGCWCASATALAVCYWSCIFRVLLTLSCRRFAGCFVFCLGWRYGAVIGVSFRRAGVVCSRGVRTVPWSHASVLHSVVLRTYGTRLVTSVGLSNSSVLVAGKAGRNRGRCL